MRRRPHKAPCSVARRGGWPTHHRLEPLAGVREGGEVDAEQHLWRRGEGREQRVERRESGGERRELRGAAARAQECAGRRVSPLVAAMLGQTACPATATTWPPTGCGAEQSGSAALLTSQQQQRSALPCCPAGAPPRRGRGTARPRCAPSSSGCKWREEGRAGHRWRPGTARLGGEAAGPWLGGRWQAGRQGDCDLMQACSLGQRMQPRRQGSLELPTLTSRWS